MLKRKNLGFILVMFFLISCATTGNVPPNVVDQNFVNTNYKILHASAITVDATMTALGDLYKAGKLSEDQKQRAIDAHKTFQKAYDKAVEDLKVYTISPSELNKSNVEISMGNLGVQVAAVVAINVLTK